jgi:uncharacterized protein
MSLALQLARPEPIDLGALEAFLNSKSTPPGSMGISELDGFLTAIVIAPELVLPSEWLPAIWNGGDPSFADEGEAKSILVAIMGRYNEIIHQVDELSPAPVFYADIDGSVLPFGWADGFVRGMALRPEAWGKLVLSKRDQHLLLPLLALSTDQDGEPFLEIDPVDEKLFIDESATLIPATIVAIAGYWRDRRKRVGHASHAPGEVAVAAIPISLRVGRNAPCPCGSGKKLKKCCGP